MTKTAVERPDLADEKSPGELRVVQMTGEKGIPCAHVYMEAQVFSPDGRLILYERNGNAHEPVANDPEHRYMICDIEDGCRSWPVTEELNAAGIAWSPDGQFIYYFVDNPGRPDTDVELKRVRPDGTERGTLCVIGKEYAHDFMMRFIYPHSTISSDSRRLASGACVIDRKSGGESWGIVVFDLLNGSAEVIWRESDLLNAHAQYCRSEQVELAHDLLVQQNHGYLKDTATGEFLSKGALDPLGVDVHVIRDDGTNLRSMPWGRGGRELPQGHQCWRGDSGWAITSTLTMLENHTEARLIEALPAPDSGHLGLNSPGAVRNDLSGEFPDPQFHHFGTDKSGFKMISDYWFRQESEHLYLFELGAPGEGPARQIKYLIDSRTSFSRKTGHANKTTQSHPFLSPDGRRAFFNSDETGVLQAYMIENLPF